MTMTSSAPADRRYLFCLSRRAAFLSLLALVVLIVMAFLTRAAWLAALGRWLVMSDALRAADAIIVLGGGSGEREVWAARLYGEGMAPLIITNGERVRVPGETRTFAEISASQLERLGVPADAIRMLPETTSTRDEAVASRKLLAALGARSAIVVSDPYHMRRAALTFNLVYQASGIAILYSPCPTAWFDARRWWRTERAFLAVTGEYQKLLFYLLNGWLF